MAIVALIDGEHHPPVVRDALAALARDEDIAAVMFVGGMEKVSDGVLDDPQASYGFAVTRPRASVRAELCELAARHSLHAVVDLSGDPVLAGDARFGLAAVALHLGLEYRAPGMRLTPPPATRVEAAVPVVAVIGTGKRTGKTAVGTHLAALLREGGHAPVVVAMGRGGPPEPRLVRADELPDVPALIELAAAGDHAASDYLEDAVLARVTTVGCRRCGEGPAGETFGSNVVDGVRLALAQEPGVVVVEGSGAALPPVAADRTVCVTTAGRVRVDALSHLGPVRLLRADLLVLLGAAGVAPSQLDDLQAALAGWVPPEAVVPCELEPEPAEPLPAGARVACFTTADPAAEPRQRAALARHGVDPVVWSGKLARRRALEDDVEEALRAGCDVFLTELKAAAIEVVATRAAASGARVAFLRNRPVPLDGGSLDERLLRLVEAGVAAA